MDTEDLSFAEGTLAMRGFIPEEAEFPGLLTDMTEARNDAIQMLQQTGYQVTTALTCHQDCDNICSIN